MTNPVMPEAPEDWLALRKMIGEMMAQDPQSAVDWAQTMPEKIREAMVREVLSEIARQQPEQILKWLPLIEDRQEGGMQRSRGGYAIVETAVRSALSKDPKAGLAWLRQSWTDFSRSCGAMADMSISRVLGEALKDGRITLQDAFMATPPGQPWKIQQSYEYLSVPQFKEAAEWIRSLEGDNGGLLGGLLPAWARLDPDGASAFINSISEPKLAVALKASLMGDITEDYDHYPEDRRMELLAKSVQESYSRHYPFRAERYRALVERVISLPGGEDVAGNFAESWGRADPLSAVDWSASLTEEAQRHEAVRRSVMGWAGEDAWGASEWTAAQPAGAVRDAAAAALVHELADEEPDSAWRWAAGIGDAETRHKHEIMVFATWRGTDAAAADAALNTLPAEEQSAIRAAMENPPP